MTRSSIVLFLFSSSLALAFPACADTTIDLESFDRSCTDSSECTTVFADVCGCGCDEVAINAREEERYNEERAAKYEHCEQLTCPVCEGPSAAICRDKVCVVE